MKVGLVLEGGAMRGMYTAGIIDTFLEENIKIDCAVGTSAGVLFGINYKSGQKGRVIRYNKKYNSDKNYMGIRPLIKEGNIVSTEYAYYKVPRQLDPFDDEAYKKSYMPFFAVATEMESGEPVYFKIESVLEQMEMLRASGSMPFVSKPVIIEDRKYLDGGISDSIPYRWAQDNLGCDKLIVILTRDIDYRKKPIKKGLAWLIYSKYPNLYARLCNRHLEYNSSVETLLQWEKEGKAFVFRPASPLPINRIEKDPEKLQRVYEMGIADARDRLLELKDFLGL